MAKYHYQALSDREIRVLDLAAGDASSALCCTIRHGSLDALPPYEALSYTWGIPDKTEKIACHGGDIDITYDLKSALLRLRDPVQTRTLWIDQICINQQDTLERNQQVRLMGEVYPQASGVLVWIGEEDEDTRVGLAALPDLLKALPVDRGNRVISHSDIINKFGLLVYNSGSWNALGGLFARPWFRRVWVIQEAALAKLATVQCGSHIVSWPDMVDLCRFQVGLEKRESEAHDAMLAIEGLRERHTQGIERPLTEMLSMSVDFKSTDPRDKLFGLLGLATDAQATELDPDYSQSVQEVYGKVTRFLIGRDKSLAVLCDARNPKRLVGLPSWTPDWSIPHTVQRPLGSRLQGKYMAAQTTKAKTRFSEDHGTLFVRGVAVDRISTLGNVFPLPPTAEDILLQWEEMAQAVQPYPTGEGFQTVYWRTLLADNGRGDAVADKYNQDLYEAWYCISDRQKPGTWTPILDIDTLNRRAVEFHSTMVRICTGRRVFTSQKGYLGLGPGDAREGDMICVLHGGPVPFLLHQHPTQSYQNFIGECFVHGMMNGEALGTADLVQEFALR